MTAPSPFHQHNCLAILTALLLTSASAGALADTTYDEQYKLIKAPNAVKSVGPGLFGDRVNLYNGSLEFVQTDVSLRGNDSLSVAMGRRLVAGVGARGARPFGRWEPDIPHLYGIFSSSKGWVSPTGSATARCSDFGAPDYASGLNNTSTWSASEFWQGNFMYIPGVGNQQLLLRDPSNSNVPSGSVATYPVVTAQHWSISCLASLANDTTTGKIMGQGFLAISPDGTQYRFDWMTDFTAPALTKSEPGAGFAVGVSPAEGKSEICRIVGYCNPIETPTPDASTAYILNRKEVWILPTLVTDRFGNWVRYTYDPARPRNVTKIESSDGRVLTIGYVTTDDLIRSVFDGTRTWNYAYSNGDLITVTLPDNSTWQFGNAYGMMTQGATPYAGDCDSPAPLSAVPLAGTMQHPSGASGTFTLTPTTHGRSDVPNTCVYTAEGTRNAILRWFYTNSLTTKTISGPGMGNLSWTYNYGSSNSSWAPCNACVTTKTVSVTDPAGHVTTHVFGNRYEQTEGRIEEVGVVGLRTSTTRYRALGAGPYPDRLGSAETSGGDSELLARPAPVDQRVTTQQGVTFTWTANSFDSFERPLSATRASSLGMSSTATTAYADDLTNWVLGQIATVTESTTGKVMVANVYNATTATLTSVSHYGHLDTSMTYYTDGTLNTVKDAKNQVTTYSNYKRGIPQNIRYADLSAESAVVNNMGALSTLTNAAGYTTTLGYDAMGRLASITHPAGDSVVWNPTSIAFAQVAATEIDVAAGHWRQTVTTGNARTITYYDGLLRPVYTYTDDVTNTAGTSRIVKRQFDYDGRTTFKSYPKRTAGETTDGVQTEYDALGRVTGTSSNSELGTLSTYVAYNGGFRKTYTDARSNSTTTSYEAFDEPSENAISTIAAPEGVSVVIVRDVFGKSTSITRSGAGKSATRSYVYDAKERLCKTIEPETGATVQDYDAANNVLWRATGLSLPSTTACDTASVAAAKKISFGYDTRNRLADTTYSDGSSAITRTYTADGLPNTIISNGAAWTNTYNKRRLNERESLVYGGATYNIDRSYDPNGSLLQLKYPDSTTVGYNPNALGEPRQVGTYAGSITYHPSGAIASFTYGNGIVHTMTPNSRGLPTVSRDVGVLNDSYTYDENANVKSIGDLQESISTRAMAYDNLDRLTTTTSAATFGTVTNSYDTLDNLTNVTVTQGPTARSTTHNFDPATNRLTSISSATGAYNLGFGYDIQGNITTRGSRGFVFDQGNRMKSAVGTATYAYDGLGHRVSTVGTDGVNRVSVYTQGGQLLYTRSTSVPPATGTKYIYLGRHQVAEVKAAGAN